MRTILLFFVFLALGIQNTFSSDDFIDVDKERVYKRDSLLKLISGAQMPNKIVYITDLGAVGNGIP